MIMKPVLLTIFACVLFCACDKEPDSAWERDIRQLQSAVNSDRATADDMTQFVEDACVGCITLSEYIVKRKAYDGDWFYWHPSVYHLWDGGGYCIKLMLDRDGSAYVMGVNTSVVPSLITPYSATWRISESDPTVLELEFADGARTSPRLLYMNNNVCYFDGSALYNVEYGDVCYFRGEVSVDAGDRESNMVHFGSQVEI